MAFDTRAGTRGARQPRAGLILRLVNKTTSSRIRRTGKLMGTGALILTTVGARTGAERTTPVGWFPGPDGSWLIVASAAGAVGNPAWYYNIAARPDQVKIEVDGHAVPVTAEPGCQHGRGVSMTEDGTVTAIEPGGSYSGAIVLNVA